MSIERYVCPSPPMRERILAALDRTPAGLKMPEIAAACGIATRCAQHYMAWLRQHEIVVFGPVQAGPNARWYLPKNRLAARAAFDAASKAALLSRRARDLARKRKSKADARAEKEREALAWQDQMPVQRIVPAAECQPMGRIGPVSVFQLGSV